MPSLSRLSAAALIVSQSEDDPMMIPTRAFIAAFEVGRMLGERPLDRGRVDVTHDPADVLARTRVRRAAAQTLRLEKDLQQERRQFEALQLLRLLPKQWPPQAA